jgi:hypothetical protein
MNIEMVKENFLGSVILYDDLLVEVLELCVGETR